MSATVFGGAGAPELDLIAEGYIRDAATPSAGRCRARAADRFRARFGSLAGWLAAPVEARTAVPVTDRAYAAHAAVMSFTAVDGGFVVASHCQWARHVAARDPLAAAQFRSEAADLGFTDGQAGHMWSRLAQICVLTGQSPETLTGADYRRGHRGDGAARARGGWRRGAVAVVSPGPAVYVWGVSPVRRWVVMDNQSSASVEDGGRVFFRDVKPYAIVDRLDQLRGPASGTVELSHSVLWAPGGGLVDLDRPGALRMAYRAVLNEGTVEDLVRVLNRDVLIAVWPELLLPLRVLAMWESRFPELRSSAAA